MKLKTPDGYEIEMTPEEFRDVAPGLYAQFTKIGGAVEEPHAAGEEVASREVISRVLERRSVPNGQIALFRALLKAGDAGLSQDELAAQMKRDVQQLNGVLGALGRRINGTDGAEPGQGILLMLIITNRNGKWHYALAEEARQVLLKGGYAWLEQK